MASLIRLKSSRTVLAIAIITVAIVGGAVAGRSKAAPGDNPYDPGLTDTGTANGTCTWGYGTSLGWRCTQWTSYYGDEGRYKPNIPIINYPDGSLPYGYYYICWRLNAQNSAQVWIYTVSQPTGQPAVYKGGKSYLQGYNPCYWWGGSSTTPAVFHRALMINPGKGQRTIFDGPGYMTRFYK